MQLNRRDEYVPRTQNRPRLQRARVDEREPVDTNRVNP